MAEKMQEKYTYPAYTADLIVPYEEGIVLVQRENEPFKGFWALPGGFQEGLERITTTGVRELFEETNLIANEENLKPLGVYSELGRDPRGEVIANVFEVLKYEGILRAGDDASRVRIFQKIPENLAFDHNKILEDYFRMKTGNQENGN